MWFHDVRARRSSSFWQTFASACFFLVWPQSGIATTTFLDPVADNSEFCAPSFEPCLDITVVTAGFDDSRLELSATVAEGFDASNVAFLWSLDVDLDPSTGASGVDWRVFFGSLLDPSLAFLVQPGGDFFASFPVAFGASSFSVSVPLDPDPDLGLPDDGEVLFNLGIGVPIDEENFRVTDFAPNDGAFVGPTTVIPEPSCALLLATGLAGLAVRRRVAACS